MDPVDGPPQLRVGAAHAPAGDDGFEVGICFARCQVFDVTGGEGDLRAVIGGVQVVDVAVVDRIGGADIPPGANRFTGGGMAPLDRPWDKERWSD
jgi:hypothetical protein